MNHDPYVFAAVAALTLFALYRRFRRLFGRQPLLPARLKLRVALLSLVALVIVARGAHSANLVAAALGGLAIGCVLAYIGLRLTRFDIAPAGIFYTPNGYLGAALSAVLIGRLAYRFQVIYPAMQAQGDAGDPLGAFQRSPLTLALFGVLVGYYLAYAAGLTLRAAALQRAAKAQDAAAPSPPSGP